MSRAQALIESAITALESPTPSTLYQWVQQLDSEYVHHRYPELLVHYVPDYPLSDAQQLALLSAVEAMRLAVQLQLHTHSRRVFTAATLCRALNDNLETWQKDGLKQPLWCAAFYNPNTRLQADSYYFSQWALTLAQAQLAQDNNLLSPLLSGDQRARYWLFAQHLRYPPSWTTGSRLESLDTGQEVYLLTATPGYWLVFDNRHQKLSKIKVHQQQSWSLADKGVSAKLLQQFEYLRALNHDLSGTNFSAPKALLSAIKRYTSGSGALTPIIQYIEQRPALTDSIRQAALEKRIQANDPARMDLKHLYLWLGGHHAAIVLATASLQQQFMQQRVPLQQSLMQRLNLLTDVLQRLSQLAQVPLPAPAPLLTLLTAADLFREPRLLRAYRWPAVETVNGLTKHAWLGLPARTDSTVAKQRMARQLSARWQLQKQLKPLLEDNDHSPLAALMAIANTLVVTTFHPQAQLAADTQKQIDTAMTQLNLNTESVQSALNQSIASCHPCCPLTELASVAPNHSLLK